MTLIPQVREQLQIAAQQRARPRRRAQLDAALRWLPAVAALTVALVVGAGAVVLLHARTGRTPTGRSLGAQPLLRELAVLRQGQPPADLPPLLARFVAHVEQPALLGEVDRRLIRLATVTSWGERVYLAPVRPLSQSEIERLPVSRRAMALRLRRREGTADQLAYFFTSTLGAQTGSGGCCATASALATGGAGSWGGDGSTTVATLVVPDGVRRVTLEFPRQEGLGARIYPHAEAVSATVHGNVVAFRIRNRSVDDPFSYMTWYGANGRRLKQFGDLGRLDRVVAPPRPAPPSRLSVVAQRDPAIPNPVAVSPVRGGIHARFSVSFRSLLNRARYQYVVSGPGGSGCTKTTTGGDGWVNFGALGVRGERITHALSAGYMGRSAWCPGTFRISVRASVPAHGSWRNGLGAFGAATVTVRH
jgi:hypothetical protein